MGRIDVGNSFKSSVGAQVIDTEMQLGQLRVFAGGDLEISPSMSKLSRSFRSTYRTLTVNPTFNHTSPMSLSMVPWGPFDVLSRLLMFSFPLHI